MYSIFSIAVFLSNTAFSQDMGFEVKAYKDRFEPQSIT